MYIVCLYKKVTELQGKVNKIINIMRKWIGQADNNLTKL